ncbi:MAG: twin-arginine translocase TatA/TatE family subunit [Thermoleophilia bacterium]|nr:twin-arginine translocase TatA/TatE family subunit [Thermoleophilia bacterium]
MIVLAIALLILGPRKLPQIGRGLGSGMREFSDGIRGVTRPMPEARRRLGEVLRPVDVQEGPGRHPDHRGAEAPGQPPGRPAVVGEQGRDRGQGRRPRVAGAHRALPGAVVGHERPVAGGGGEGAHGRPGQGEVAGQHQDHRRARRPQPAEQAPQRPAGARGVGHQAGAGRRPVPARHQHLAAVRGEDRHRALQQGGPVEGRRRLGPAHAGAEAAGQHDPGGRAPRPGCVLAVHARIMLRARPGGPT